MLADTGKMELSLGGVPLLMAWPKVAKMTMARASISA